MERLLTQKYVEVISYIPSKAVQVISHVIRGFLYTCYSLSSLSTRSRILALLLPLLFIARPALPMLGTDVRIQEEVTDKVIEKEPELIRILRHTSPYDDQRNWPTIKASLDKEIKHVGKGSSYGTPFIHMVANSRTPLVTYVLERVKLEQKLLDEALYVASSSQNTEICEALLDSGANKTYLLDMQTAGRKEVLIQVGMSEEDQERFDECINYTLLPHVPQMPDFITFIRNTTSDTDERKWEITKIQTNAHLTELYVNTNWGVPFLDIIQENRLRLLRYVLEETDAEQQYLDYGLNLACSYGHEDIAKHLLSLGANPNVYVILYRAPAKTALDHVCSLGKKQQDDSTLLSALVNASAKGLYIHTPCPAQSTWQTLLKSDSKLKKRYAQTLVFSGINPTLQDHVIFSLVYNNLIKDEPNQVTVAELADKVIAAKKALLRL